MNMPKKIENQKKGQTESDGQKEREREKERAKKTISTPPQPSANTPSGRRWHLSQRTA